MNNSSIFYGEYPFVDECSNWTMLEYGVCYGYTLCGLCYGGGFRVFTPVYDTYNLIVIGVLLPIVGCLGSDLQNTFLIDQCVRKDCKMYWKVFSRQIALIRLGG